MDGSLRLDMSDPARIPQELYEKTIWQCFEETARAYPDEECLVIDGEGSFSYGQILKDSLQLACGLYKDGVQAGSHTAIYIRSSLRFTLAVLALSRLGAVKIPVNVSLGGNEFSYVLAQSDAEYLITDMGQPAELDGSRVRRVFTAGGAPVQMNIPVTAWDELCAEDADPDKLPVLSGAGSAVDISDIIYTSGSTSAPKGVMLTHKALLMSAAANCANRKFEKGRRVFIPLPLFHVYGYVEGLLSCFMTGGTVLVKEGKFDAPGYVRFMKEQRANDILSVPAQMITLTRYLKENPCKLPDLRAVYCSASVCPDWVWPAIRKYLQVSDVITGYGMTELAGAVMQSKGTEPNVILATRVGKLLYPDSDLECRIEDGELWCRGPVVTAGYYNKPECNKAAFTADGWFRTGDCGYFDAGGQFVMTGRLDDRYKINGENVSPKYIEEVLCRCEGVVTAQVVGVRDEKHGYVGVCFAQLEKDTPQNRERLKTYAQENLAKYQVPKHMYFLEEKDWPRTSTGKVQKFRLREMVLEKSS